MNTRDRFICAGAQKAGTTAFYDLLRNHPEICLSRKKEVHYFDVDANYERGKGWYDSHFKGCDTKMVKGEITPDYMLYNFVPKRIYETLGDRVKLIFILRNPAERAYSQFNFHIMQGLEKRKHFKELIGSEPLDMVNEKYITWYNPAYYFSKGLYFNQISRFLDYYPLEQMLILKYEELFGDEQFKQLEKVADFLEIEEFTEVENRKSHQTKVPKSNFQGNLLRKLKQNKKILSGVKKIVPKQTYYKLRSQILSKTEQKAVPLPRAFVVDLNKRFFETDILELEALTKENFSSWLK